MAETVTYWKDKPLSECSREELIEAVEWLAASNERWRDTARRANERWSEAMQRYPFGPMGRRVGA